MILCMIALLSAGTAMMSVPPEGGSGLETLSKMQRGVIGPQSLLPSSSGSGQRENETARGSDVVPSEAEVLEVAGDVRRAAPGTSAARDDGWEPVRVGDHLGGGTLIRTGLRSLLVLRFGTDTYVRIDRATLATISEFVRRGDVDDIHLGLGYGAIRGGTSAGRIRSSLTVEAPVATLAKRGTRDWEIRVEPGTSRFTIALATEGLVEAIRKFESGRTVSRLVRPGEYADQDNIARMWLKAAQFDRAFTFFRAEGLTDSDVEFTVTKGRGLAAIAPAEGTQTRALVRRDDRLASGVAAPPIRSATGRVLDRPEGNFGIARADSN